MKVVILCGGKGTRLREETEYRPKPMVPIGGRPILWHIMKTYATHGFKDFILCLGYKGNIIKEYFRNYQWMSTDVTLQLGEEPCLHFHDKHDEESWTVTLAETGEETMTGGRIERIRRHLGDDEEFFLTYGDGVSSVDIRAELAFHRCHKNLLTLTAVHPPGRFGELTLDEEDSVKTFNEKPQTEAGWINGGYFIASTKIFDYLQNADNVMFEQEPMRRIAAAGEIKAFKHSGFWYPMDTYQENLFLNRLWNEGKAPWKVW
ncbi:MAG: glucose-1-phosphate cytidylyltransferase [Chthoniobacteraceae bacterium]